MGALAVCGCVAFAIFLIALATQPVDADRLLDDARNRDNLRRRNIHLAAGNLSYPHELADGRVRWYRVDHDPVEL